MLCLCVYDTAWRMCSTTYVQGQWKVSDLPKLEDHICAGPVEGVRAPKMCRACGRCQIS